MWKTNKNKSYANICQQNTSAMKINLIVAPMYVKPLWRFNISLGEFTICDLLADMVCK